MRKNETKILWLPDWSNWIKCTLKKVKYSAEDALWILCIFEYTCKMGNWILFKKQSHRNRANPLVATRTNSIYLGIFFQGLHENVHVFHAKLLL